MENLAIHRKVALTGEHISHLCCDSQGTFYALSNKERLEILEYPSDSVTPVAHPLKLLFPEDCYLSTDNDIVGLWHSQDSSSFTLILRKGQVYVFNSDSIGRYVGEEVGCFPAGVLAASLSPDEELLSLCTADDKFILLSMSSLFPLVEVSISEMMTTFQSQHVSVGWGKKETQFHGSAGKQAALSKVTIKESQLSNDDNLVRLSWKSDSSCVALSLLYSHPQLHREIVVIDREGSIVSIKEATEGLGNALAWRPDGLIAASHQHPNGSKGVVFFEKNGLRHGEFYLPVSPIPEDNNFSIKELQWNMDGSILAMLLSDGKVLLWTVANAHWYLKQSIPGKFTQITWSTTSPSILLCITSWGGIVFYEFVRRFDRSSMASNDKFNMVAVVDGYKLHLTPFKLANIPPPFSYTFIPLEHVPSCVSVYCGHDGCRVVVCSPAGKVFIYLIAMHEGRMEFAEISSFHSGTNLKQVVLQDLENIFCLPADGLKLCFENEDKEVVERNVISYLARYGRMIYIDAQDNIWIGDEQTPFLSNVTVSVHSDFFISNDEIYFVTLTKDNSLLVNDMTIMDNCTSFIILDEFLVATTPTGICHFYPLSKQPAEWQHLSGSKGEEFSRISEDGALCVAAVPNEASLILQMPRGNLETVYPRSLVLSLVRKFLSTLNYRDAFLLCRKQRVDLNILHDENPELFLSTIAKFVEQVGEADYLNLFLTNLRAENVKITKYGAFTVNKQSADDHLLPDKVNNVCDSIRDLLLSIDAVKYAESIMTAFVCRSPPDYKAALSAIVDLSSTCPDAVEKSLKYLIFLVSADKLYRVALEMYNLPLALSVARRSQMDPSEYLPLLEKWQSIENEDRRKFEIDNFLGRHANALKSLVASGTPFEECLDYIKRLNLYQVAFQIYLQSSMTEEWKLTCFEYANHLLSSNAASIDAIQLYRLADKPAEALNLAITCGEWRTVLELLTEDSSDVSSSVSSLIDVLVGKQKYSEALLVAEKYNMNAFTVAVEGELWLDAHRLAAKDNQKMQTLNVSLKKAVDWTVEKVKNLETDFEEKSLRLEGLLQKLVEALDYDKIVAALESTSTTGVDISDTLSQLSIRTGTTFAGSQISSISRATSSKSRKKAERQKMKCKPGSPYERESLRESLKGIKEETLKLWSKTIDLLRIIALDGMFTEAQALQGMFMSLLGKMENVFGRIRKLVQLQEDKMTERVLGLLGISPLSIPDTLKITHEWKISFDIPADWQSLKIVYL